MSMSGLIKMMDKPVHHRSKDQAINVGHQARVEANRQCLSLEPDMGTLLG